MRLDPDDAHQLEVEEESPSSASQRSYGYAQNLQNQEDSKEGGDHDEQKYTSKKFQTEHKE